MRYAEIWSRIRPEAIPAIKIWRTIPIVTRPSGIAVHRRSAEHRCTGVDTAIAACRASGAERNQQRRGEQECSGKPHALLY
jgi:hypothetical protein